MEVFVMTIDIAVQPIRRMPVDRLSARKSLIGEKIRYRFGLLAVRENGILQN
ncbi:MAG TPA: hypothetical protein VMI35_02000 [Puia sp.]|nr:hypothetical protein [Puia sp.]